MQVQPSRTIRRAFTIIELLVVIAIIAILAAILFPVFALVREQTRQSSTISNMHEMYVGAKVFYEDEGRYPSALFGYAELPLVQSQPTDPPAEPPLKSDIPASNIVPTPLDKVTGRFNTNSGAGIGYLYGNQVKDYNTFLCADNLVNNKQQVTEVYYPIALAKALGYPSPYMVPVTWQAGDNALPSLYSGDQTADVDYPCREIATNPTAFDCSSTNGYDGSPKYYYVMDSMDIGPMIDTTGKQMTDPATKLPAYELHYSPDWTHMLYNATTGLDTYQNVYGVANGTPITQQLKYKNPPTENTILCWNTHHAATAGSPNVIILLASGTARKISIHQAYGSGELPLQYK